MRRREDVLVRLRQRLVNDLHFGRIAIGTRLPSARRLARELHADPRVVHSAYRQLEQEGLVRRRPGSRAFFAARGGAPGEIAPTAEWLVEILVQALAHGIPAPRIPEELRRSLATVALRAACVECTDDHIRWLCGEVSEDYGLASAPIDSTTIRPEAPPAALLEADLWVTTASHASELAPLADRHRKPLVVVTLRQEIVSEVTRLLAAGPVWFVCTDPRCEAKLRALYETEAGGENVRAVVLDRHDPASIPAGAPAWLFRTARERLGGAPPHVRELPTFRLFSEESGRRLLSLVVRANRAASEAIAVR